MLSTEMKDIARKVFQQTYTHLNVITLVREVRHHSRLLHSVDRILDLKPGESRIASIKKLQEKAWMYDSLN